MAGNFKCEILDTYLLTMYLHRGINSIYLSNAVLKLLALQE